jgi:hypothetical protein
MESYCSLCTLDTIHRLCFVTRLIINKINKVQWVNFKLENVLVSLHSLKTMSLAQIFFTPFPKILIDVKYRYDRYNTGKSKVNLRVQDRMYTKI